MKKFSKLTGQKVSILPKVDKKVNEKEIFKVEILRLMDDFLRVQMYGPITRYHVAGSMKVAGKEIFLEALMDLINNKSEKDIKSVLESLKSDIGDWESIDRNIDKLNTDKSTYTQRLKISKLYNRYKDKETLINYCEKSANMITNKESLVSRIRACEDLIKDPNYNSDTISTILEKYINRLNTI